MGILPCSPALFFILCLIPIWYRSLGKPPFFLTVLRSVVPSLHFFQVSCCGGWLGRCYSSRCDIDQQFSLPPLPSFPIYFTSAASFCSFFYIIIFFSLYIYDRLELFGKLIRLLIDPRRKVEWRVRDVCSGWRWLTIGERRRPRRFWLVVAVSADTMMQARNGERWLRPYRSSVKRQHLLDPSAHQRNINYLTRSQTPSMTRTMKRGYLCICHNVSVIPGYETLIASLWLPVAADRGRVNQPNESQYLTTLKMISDFHLCVSSSAHVDNVAINRRRETVICIIASLSFPSPVMDQRNLPTGHFWIISNLHHLLSIRSIFGTGIELNQKLFHDGVKSSQKNRKKLKNIEIVSNSKDIGYASCDIERQCHLYLRSKSIELSLSPFPPPIQTHTHTFASSGRSCADRFLFSVWFHADGGNLSCISRSVSILWYTGFAIKFMKRARPWWWMALPVHPKINK